MAKRKRLTPASSTFLGAAPETKSALGAPLRAAPIADIARDAAASAAAEDLSRAMSEARAEGRMVISVPLDEIDLDYLVRDRVVSDDEEMQTLKESLRARGQQTPIEVVAREGARYGLISGWRRCAALRTLYEESSEPRFASVLCLLRQPAEHAESYVAMVEENEIRVGLSYFERARIVVKAVEEGVFETDRTALQTLFQSASRAKRSKIGSFLGVVRALDGVLHFPAALTERQGLHLARALAEEDGLADTLRNTLQRASLTSPEAETALLAKTVATPPSKRTPPPAAPSPAADKGKPVVGGIQMQYEAGRLVLEGRAVNDALRTRLV
ncbi:MAG: ParB N-terminal domain-containing protein, partial [Pseudomonadota bacterium]